MLSRLNVAEEELETFTKQIKERRMGELFANFKGYDVQAARVVWKKEGREEGKAEGEAQKLTSLVRKKIRKNMSIAVIAEILEEEVSVITPIYDLLQAHPDWDDEKISNELMARTKIVPCELPEKEAAHVDERTNKQ